MTDAELLAAVRSAVADWERADARRVTAIRGAKDHSTRTTTVDDIADAAGLSREGVYKLLRRRSALPATDSAASAVCAWWRAVIVDVLGGSDQDHGGPSDDLTVLANRAASRRWYPPWQSAEQWEALHDDINRILDQVAPSAAAEIAATLPPWLPSSADLGRVRVEAARHAEHHLRAALGPIVEEALAAHLASTPEVAAEPVAAAAGRAAVAALVAVVRHRARQIAHQGWRTA